MAELRRVKPPHGRGVSWETNCEECGNKIYLGKGSEKAIQRLVSSVKRVLCGECENK